jgi:hypothetical protein
VGVIRLPGTVRQSKYQVSSQTKLIGLVCVHVVPSALDFENLSRALVSVFKCLKRQTRSFHIFLLLHFHVTLAIECNFFFRHQLFQKRA